MNAQEKLLHPQLFVCADRVKVPQVGDDERNFKSFHLEQAISRHFLQPVETYNKKYIKKISADLIFSEEVVRHHAAHTLPYDKDAIWRSFDPSSIVDRKPAKTSGIMGRYNQRGAEKKHLPCHIKTISQHRLKPLKKKVKHPKPDNIKDKEDEVKTKVSSPQDLSKKSSVFLTQDETVDENQQNKLNKKSSTKWDEHLMMSLSKNTARWIVSERLSEGPQQDKLNRLLIDIYGESLTTVDTLIRDDASISDLGSAEGTDLPARPKSLPPVPSTTSTLTELKKDVIDDDINSQSLASFYRLPGGVRRTQRNLEKELSGAINATAKTISIPQKKIKPPPTLKDVMNAGVGNKIYETDNQYEQEWLSGAQLVPRKDNSILTFDTGNKYRKVKQENYPADPKHWHSKEKSKISKKGHKPTKDKLPHKGYRKWSDLPKPIENEATLSIHEAGYDAEAHRDPDPMTLKQHRSNIALIRVVDEWRNKWHLGNKWYDSSIDDLERDMSDINEHVRLQAIATVARAATFRPQADPGIPLKSKIMKWRAKTTSMMIGLAGTFKKSSDGKEGKKHSEEGILPDKLYNCVIKALRDTSIRVRVTAAMALYTLNRPNEEPPYEEARKTLHEVIRVGNPPERWAAAQCLAHAGVCDSYVVGELVKQFFDSTEPVKLEQCVHLMSKLSDNSTLVHSMIAEQLNSTNWQHRMMACKVLPKLHGLVNKDIMHKLATLMWHDWHHEVRRVAAQTLGKTGHGKEVHNDLHDRILTGTERDKVDALQKIAHLGIMTARLLPAYLQCFDDGYISVRLAAARTAGILIVDDDRVLRKLLFMTQFDTNWKVKAHAIQALALVGKVTTPIRDAIIWALRFEAEPGVRAEACSALISLKITGDDIAYILQDKLLVEPEQLVRSQIVLALESMGLSSHGDMDMVLQIKEEVRRLCTRYNIAAKIAQNEKKENNDLYVDKYFNIPKSPELPDWDENKDERVMSVKTRGTSASRPSTRHSVRTTTPSIIISLEDDINDSSDTSLFLANGGRDHRTGGLTGSSKGSRVQSAHDRRTPEERLEKLIDLYEGICTSDEYNEFAHPDDKTDEGSASKSNVEVLESIPEKEMEEKPSQTGDTEASDVKPAVTESPMDRSTSISTLVETISVGDHLDKEFPDLMSVEDSVRPSTDMTSNVESVDIEQFEEAIEAIKNAQHSAKDEAEEEIAEEEIADERVYSNETVDNKEIDDKSVNEEVDDKSVNEEMDEKSIDANDSLQSEPPPESRASEVNSWCESESSDD
ncbi:HEAT repeat-containing protein 4-like isoform X2 [Antedon mediterranea]|uniref:HEAT repeat-containing protein 4-like isoform X2 n=1 Tax=Antedon mediterranea TaxID=105859 RepID=UPI003AF55CDE